ncbi:DUF7424 family protein [Salinicola tamaricis]|uniref:DUF7424 family protein n=1 Tax=Salinicola tamaricis TaxID=1771309 RepID=UPI000D0A5090|nr:hypothetical protein [Salinicola tamaricis]
MDAAAFVSPDTLSLTSDPRRLLGLAIPPAVLERIDKVQRENLGPTPEYEVRLQVINDLGRDVDTAVLASWLDDDPVTFGSVNFAQGETRSLRLSNVLIDRAMQKGKPPSWSTWARRGKPQRPGSATDAGPGAAGQYQGSTGSDGRPRPHTGNKRPPELRHTARESTT